MGLNLGKRLKKLTWKKVGKGVGKVLDNKIVKGAAALGLAATGVGAPAAAAIMGGAAFGSKMAQGKRLTTGLKAGVKDGALTYAGAKILPKVTGMMRGGGAGEIGLPGGDIASAAEPGRFRKIAGGIGDFIGGSDGFGMDDVLKYGKAAGDAYGAYTGAKDQDRYRQLAEQNYAANAPLRDAGRTMLMDTSTPDLSGLFQDPTAPQGRYRKVNVGSRGMV